MKRMFSGKSLVFLARALAILFGNLAFSSSVLALTTANLTTEQCQSLADNGAAQCLSAGDCDNSYIILANGQSCDVSNSFFSGKCCVKKTNTVCQGTCAASCSSVNGVSVNRNGSISCQIKDAAKPLCCVSSIPSNNPTSQTPSNNPTSQTPVNNPTSQTPSNNPTSQTPPNNPTGSVMETVTFKSPLKYETVQTFLGEGLLGALQSIVAILALVFLLIGALLYITSGGSDGQVKVAKGAITAALIGFAIALAAPTFLKEIATILGWGPGDPNVADVSGALSLGEILMKVLNFLLGIFGIVAIIMLLIGGLSYLSSAGDEDRIDSSKEIVKAALIGTVIAFASLVIIKQIASLFGVGR